MNIRKQEIGLVSVCLCILVVFIHVSSWTIQDMDKQSIQFILLLTPWRLSAFVVQGFIFLSGLKLFLSQKPFSYGAFLRSRAKKILLPYLIWVGLYYAFFIAIGWYRFSFLDLAEYIFLGTLCAHFYFIVIIVQFYLLMPLFRALLSRFDARLLCAAALLLTIFFKLFVHFQYDDRVFCGYLFYFMLGAAVGRNYEAFCAWLARRFGFVCAAFALLAAADVYLAWRSMAFGATFWWIEALHLAYVISAILFVFGLCLFITKAAGRLPRSVALCERASYMIYLSHILPIYIANGLAARLHIGDMAAAFLFRAVFTYTVTFAGCMLYTAAKEKFFKRRRPVA